MPTVVVLGVVFFCTQLQRVGSFVLFELCDV